MASGVKDLLKNSPVYTVHRYLKTYKDYSNKYGVGLKTAFSEAKPVKYDVPLILEKQRSTTLELEISSILLTIRLSLKQKTLLLITCRLIILMLLTKI